MTWSLLVNHRRAVMFLAIDKTLFAIHIQLTKMKRLVKAKFKILKHGLILVYIIIGIVIYKYNYHNPHYSILTKHSEAAKTKVVA